MNSRGHMQPYLNSSLAIRQEIQRFESVHPSIYAIYDLIEAIPDPLIQQQIREHVVCIEDSFVNSQEWTLSRSVPDLKLGILGSINSGKSALVHRYLTGSYMQEESPEGGRFKKEVVIDGQSYLLLIRDEGGPPEMQFTHWVDAVIYVFSLENEISFNSIYNYHDKMSHFRTISEIPLILVGTQDAISESNPRLIDDIRARKLATDLKRCSYYETCATYGLNVERVFQDACSKIIQAKLSNNNQSGSRPSTPNHSGMRSYYVGPSPSQNSASKGYDSHSTGTGSSTGSGNVAVTTPAGSTTNIQSHSPPFKEAREKDKTNKKNKERSDPKEAYPANRYMRGDAHHQAMPVSCPVAPQMPHVEPPLGPPPPPDRLTPPHVQLSSEETLLKLKDALETNSKSIVDYRDFPVPNSTPLLMRRNSKKNSVQKSNSFSSGCNTQISDFNGFEPPCTPMLSRKFLSQPEDQDTEFPENPTPTGTPTQSRKNRRRSALFNAKKEDDKFLGSGRAIPIKQGDLYKKSNKPLNKEWKKKYVTLCDNGRLIIYQSIHEYMDEKEGKEILLSKTTVKIPGGRPRCAAPIQQTQIKTNPNHNGDINSLCTRTPVPHGFEMDGAMVIPNASIAPGGFNGVDFGTSGSPTSKIETPNVKKKKVPTATLR